MRHQRDNNKIQGFPENLIKTTLKSKNDMNREIKFRAWLPSINKMSYPMPINELCKMDESVPSDTVWLQYVGLKDKNGKELFQKDIIKYISGNDGESEFISEVDASLLNGIIFKDEKLCLELELYNGSYITDGNFEIIGNIYENENLLLK